MPAAVVVPRCGLASGDADGEVAHEAEEKVETGPRSGTPGWEGRRSLPKLRMLNTGDLGAWIDELMQTCEEGPRPARAPNMKFKYLRQGLSASSVSGHYPNILRSALLS